MQITADKIARQDYKSIVKFPRNLVLILIVVASLNSCSKKGPYGFETGMEIEVFQSGDGSKGSSKWVPATITDAGEDYIVITYENDTIVTVTKKQLDSGAMKHISISSK
jgi:hypothetical protein